jgi:hypothetical protein
MNLSKTYSCRATLALTPGPSPGGRGEKGARVVCGFDMFLARDLVSGSRYDTRSDFKLFEINEISRLDVAM